MALTSVAELSDERFDGILGDAPIGLRTDRLVADDEGHGEETEASEAIDGEHAVGTPGTDRAELRSSSLVLEIDQDVSDELLHEVTLSPGVVLELVQGILGHGANLFGLLREVLEAGALLCHHVEHVPVEVRGDLAITVGPVASEALEATLQASVENFDAVSGTVVDEGSEGVSLSRPAGTDEEDVNA